jgi:hypothetical protein
MDFAEEIARPDDVEQHGKRAGLVLSRAKAVTDGMPLG